MVCIAVYMEEETPKWSEVRIKKASEKEFFLMFVLIRGPQRREYLSRYIITVFQVYSVGPLINTCQVIEWMNILVWKERDKMYSKGTRHRAQRWRSNREAGSYVLSQKWQRKNKIKTFDFFKMIRLQVIFLWFFINESYSLYYLWDQNILL